jgi:hypothetical protein
MSKPVEYRVTVAGFGTWRIHWATKDRRWVLDYNARAMGTQWVPAGDYVAAESAAIAVAEKTTGVSMWDGLRFPAPAGDLKHWRTDASEGVQADAIQ